MTSSQQLCEGVGESPPLHRGGDQAHGGHIVDPEVIGHCALARKIGSYFILKSFAKNQHIPWANVIRTLSLAAETFSLFLKSGEASANTLKVPLRSVHGSSQTPKWGWNPQWHFSPLSPSTQPKGKPGIPFYREKQMQNLYPIQGFPRSQ